jgi:hypothetical protein
MLELWTFNSDLPLDSQISVWKFQPILYTGFGDANLHAKTYQSDVDAVKRSLALPINRAKNNWSDVSQTCLEFVNTTGTSHPHTDSLVVLW